MTNGNKPTEVRRGLNIDLDDANNGSLDDHALVFGINSGEGIASKRTLGAYRYGLDFYTVWRPRLSIDNIGSVIIDPHDYSDGSISHALRFGSNSGEGISSRRLPGDGQYGLDFYTAYQLRMSIDVNGNISVPGDIVLTNPQASDCAEEFEATYERLTEPGTVMTFNEKGKVQPSNSPYDKKVAGVISGAGGYKPGIILGKLSRRLMPYAVVSPVSSVSSVSFSNYGYFDQLLHYYCYPPCQAIQSSSDRLQMQIH